MLINMNRFLTISYLLTLLLYSVSCKKQDDWLDKKLNNSDVTPSSVEDFQALLDNDIVMNQNQPGLGLVGCDNYYCTYSGWLSGMTEIERNAYTWESDLFDGSSSDDWNSPYTMVAYANIVLEGIEKVQTTSKSDWNNVKGSALFYRAYAFYNLLQLFASHFDSVTSSSDLGIPLRLSSDVNVKVPRSSVKESYERVISDLTASLLYLPAKASYATRPSLWAAYSELSRVLLDMGRYEQAAAYADSALLTGSDLYDFNTDINATATRPFSGYPGNKELIFYAESALFGISLPNAARGIFDTTLYAQYEDNDIRKKAFFKTSSGKIVFKGTYTASNSPFAGIAVNELYLIKAEAEARLTNIDEALKPLNFLLRKRYIASSFVPFTSSDNQEVLEKVLLERRKEMPYTNLRWADLKRQNMDSRFAVTLIRILDGVTYTLPPGDKKYNLPIPEEEVRLNGLVQNPR